MFFEVEVIGVNCIFGGDGISDGCFDIIRSAVDFERLVMSIIFLMVVVLLKLLILVGLLLFVFIICWLSDGSDIKGSEQI